MTQLAMMSRRECLSGGRICFLVTACGHGEKFCNL